MREAELPEGGPLSLVIIEYRRSESERRNSKDILCHGDGSPQEQETTIA